MISQYLFIYLNFFSHNSNSNNKHIFAYKYKERTQQKTLLFYSLFIKFFYFPLRFKQPYIHNPLESLIHAYVFFFY